MSEIITVNIDDDSKDKLFEGLQEIFKKEFLENNSEREIDENVDQFVVEKKSNGEIRLKAKITIEFTFENLDTLTNLLNGSWTYEESSSETEKTEN